MPSINPGSAIAADLDADHHAELVFTGDGGVARLVVESETPQLWVAPLDVPGDASFGLIPGRFEVGGPTEVVRFSYGLTLRHRVADGAMARIDEPRSGDASWGLQRPMAALDVDGDGIDEIVAGDVVLHVNDRLEPDDPTGYAVLVLLRREADGWELVSELPFARYGDFDEASAASADLDGDGNRELVVMDGVEDQQRHADYDPSVHELVLMKAEDDQLVERWRGPAGTPGVQVTSGDLDGDGILDVAVRGRDRIAVLAGRGDGVLGEPLMLDLADDRPVQSPGDPEQMPVFGMAFGDFDGDGSLEIAALMLDASDGTNSFDIVVVRDPLGTPLAEPLDGFAAYGSGTFAAGDFDANGVDDLALQTGSAGDSKLSLLLTSP